MSSLGYLFSSRWPRRSPSATRRRQRPWTRCRTFPTASQGMTAARHHPEEVEAVVMIAVVATATPRHRPQICIRWLSGRTSPVSPRSPSTHSTRSGRRSVSRTGLGRRRATGQGNGTRRPGAARSPTPAPRSRYSGACCSGTASGCTGAGRASDHAMSGSRASRATSIRSPSRPAPARSTVTTTGWNGNATGGHDSLGSGPYGNCVFGYGCWRNWVVNVEVWVNGNGTWTGRGA